MEHETTLDINKDCYIGKCKKCKQKRMVMEASLLSQNPKIYKKGAFCEKCIKPIISRWGDYVAYIIFTDVKQTFAEYRKRDNRGKSV